MNITGLEVIRRNPGVAVANPGVAAIGVVAGEKIELTYGDTLKVNTSFDYRGLAGEATLRGTIGQVLWPTGRFDPILWNEVSIDLPESPEFTLCERSVDIPITPDISPRANYDLYVKLLEYPGAGMPEVDDVIDIVGIPPTYELLEEAIYPYAYVYDGDAEVTTFTFKSDPFTPASWLASKVAAAVESEVRKAGGRIMEMRVYCDKTPLLWTDWRIETVTRPETTGVAMSLGIWWLGPAILLALAIILTIIVATLVIKPILATFKRNPALEDVKPAWKKETLILTIQDSEEYWERPLTPVETLEAMSEEELRDLLDQIAEEEVPPVPPDMWPLLALAGLGVLGIGGVAAAYALSKPKE